MVHLRKQMREEVVTALTGRYHIAVWTNTNALIAIIDFSATWPALVVDTNKYAQHSRTTFWAGFGGYAIIMFSKITKELW